MKNIRYFIILVLGTLVGTILFYLVRRIIESSGFNITILQQTLYGSAILAVILIIVLVVNKYFTKG